MGVVVRMRVTDEVVPVLCVVWWGGGEDDDGEGEGEGEWGSVSQD